jgi:hypothetical protein
MVNRHIVKQFWDGIKEACHRDKEKGAREVFSLLDTYPQLAHIRFQDYLGENDPDYAFPPLYWPIASNHLPLTARLIALGADVNRFWGRPLLIVSVIRSYATESTVGTKIIELLLAAGADPNVPNHFGETSLHTAMSQNVAATIFPLLLRYGANPNQRDLKGRVPLHGWVENYVEILHMLVAHGADVNAADEKRETVLMSSIRCHCYAVAELIGYGADVHARRHDGWTALHEAASCYVDKEDLEVVPMLLKAGTLCDARDNRGYTPLHVAAARGTVKIARLLVEAGADIHAKSDAGERPLDLVQACRQPFDSDGATGKERKKTEAFLLEQGAIPTTGIVKEKKRPRTIWDV